MARSGSRFSLSRLLLVTNFFSFLSFVCIAYTSERSHLYPLDNVLRWFFLQFELSWLLLSVSLILFKIRLRDYWISLPNLELCPMSLRWWLSVIFLVQYLTRLFLFESHSNSFLIVSSSRFFIFEAFSPSVVFVNFFVFCSVLCISHFFCIVLASFSFPASFFLRMFVLWTWFFWGAVLYFPPILFYSFFLLLLETWSWKTATCSFLSSLLKHFPILWWFSQIWVFFRSSLWRSRITCPAMAVFSWTFFFFTTFFFFVFWSPLLATSPLPVIIQAIDIRFLTQFLHQSNFGIMFDIEM